MISLQKIGVDVLAFINKHRLKAWPSGAMLGAAGLLCATVAQAGVEVVRLAAATSRADGAESAPLDTLKAQARRARDERQPETAVALYRQLLKRDTGTDIRAGLAMALAESGRPAEAQAVLGAAVAAALHPAAKLELARAQTYIAMLEADWVRALNLVTQARQQFPDDEELRRSHLDILLRLGAPFQSQEARPSVGPTTPAQQLRVELDQAAAMLRWARSGPPYAPAHAFTDRALVMNADTARRFPKASEVASDRVQMLAQRGWAQQAIDLGAERADSDWPAYTRAALADAHLRLRQPERAATLYRSALKGTDKPWPIDWQVGLVYALLESSRYDECKEALKALVEAVPATRAGPGGSRLSNPDHQYVRVFEARMQAYLEDTRDARQKLERLADEAPFSGSVRRAAGDVALLSGQPRRAADIYQRLHVDDPKDSGPLLGLANAAMAQGEYAQAEARLDQVKAAGDAPEQEAKLRKQHQEEQRPYLVVEGARGNETAQSIATSREWSSNARLYSALHDQRRVFAQHVYQNAYEHRTQQVGRHQSVGVGLQWRNADRRAELGLSSSVGQDNRVGLFGSVAWTPDDHWTVEGRADSNSWTTPLRARRDGVFGRRLDLAVAHRRDDYSRWAINTSLDLLSDGNRRVGLGATWDQYWIRTPIYALSTQLGAAVGRNSEIERASYFNPLSDQSIWLHGQQQWTIHRRYEQAWMVRLGLSVGQYRQHGYASLSTWGASLEGEWRIDSGSSISLGLNHNVRPYDGVMHQQNRLLLRLEWRQ